MPCHNSALVLAGTDVVSTTVPNVLTTTEPDADAKDEATELIMLFAEVTLWPVAVKEQRVRTS